MKNYRKFPLLLLGLGILLSSCKKDAVDLTTASLSSITGDLTVVRNTIEFYADFPPGTFPAGDSLTVHVASGADPEGITIEAYSSNTETQSGRNVYRVQQVNSRFDVAAYSDEIKRKLKINLAGDIITLTFNNNALTVTRNYSLGNPPILRYSHRYFQDSHYATIRYYNDEGDKPTIKVYSDTQSEKVELGPFSEVGDGGYYSAGPDGEDFGRTSYDGFHIVFDESENNSSNVLVNDKDNYTIHVEINDKKKTVVIDDDFRAYKLF